MLFPGFPPPLLPGPSKHDSRADLSHCTGSTFAICVDANQAKQPYVASSVTKVTSSEHLRKPIYIYIKGALMQEMIILKRLGMAPSVHYSNVAWL